MILLCSREKQAAIDLKPKFIRYKTPTLRNRINLYFNQQEKSAILKAYKI